MTNRVMFIISSFFLVLVSGAVVVAVVAFSVLAHYFDNVPILVSNENGEKSICICYTVFFGLDFMIYVYDDNSAGAFFYTSIYS